jgi:hypothetical protein
MGIFLIFNKSEHYTHGFIDGSKPVSFNPFQHPDPMNLKVVDIDGTQIGSKNRINKFVGQNFNLILNDIRGTYAGSKKHGITTNRQTNPLTPAYNMPGQVELGKENNNPYGSTLKMTKKKADIKEYVPPKRVTFNSEKETAYRT